MRVREVFFHNIRNFREDRLISFVDPLTGEVRPITVVAGSNGSGKTTILEAIEQMFLYAIDPSHPGVLIREAFKEGLICIEVEFSQQEIHFANTEGFPLFLSEDGSNRIQIAVGNSENKNHKKISFREMDIKHFSPNDVGRTIPVLNRGNKFLINLSKAIEQAGGYLYFPFDRRPGKISKARIDSPTEEKDWVFHFKNSDNWQDSLEQLWVWENYLDLEKKAGENNLKSFTMSVENALGKGRDIIVQEGRVYINTGWNNEDGTPSRVRIDQLPSGEQQILLLLGEIVRRVRSGIVIAVDEVENSLHPTLQRLMMWNLRDIGKKWDAQLIVATHSLEIINSVRGGAFINLDYPEDRFNLSIEAEKEQS